MIKPYDECIFRVSENYLMPREIIGGIDREEFEHILAESGVDARWIGVYHHGGPRYRSQFLPISHHTPGDLTDDLVWWVETVHSRGMNAITWCGFHCESAWEERPEWRMQFLGEDGDFRCDCCVNTGFGEAFIGLLLEFFEKFDLDGVYIDGATISSRVGHKAPGCVCPTCRELFVTETGRETPRQVDFYDANFRAWVKWRFANFTGYLKGLVTAVHAAYPEKKIVMNHYHRPESQPILGWDTACPLDLYDCGDIITGAEGMMDTVRSVFCSKLALGYGRKVDVWQPVARWRLGDDWQFHEPIGLLHHAAAVVTGGAFPSFGFETGVHEGSMHSHAENFLRPAAEFLRKRARYVELPGSNFVAMHISQQTETFFFGRQREKTGYGWYWDSTIGWEQLMREAGAATDFIFDSHLLDTDRLGRYRAVVLPLSIALSVSQAETLTRYAENGGILILGPWSGRCDEDGEALPGDGLLAEVRGVRECGVPDANDFERHSTYMKNAAMAGTLHGFGVYTMLANQTPKESARVLLSAPATGGTAIAVRPVGKGMVVDIAPDLGASFYYAPSSPMRRFMRAVLDDVRALPISISGPPCVSHSIRRMPEGGFAVHLHNVPATIHQHGYGSGEGYRPIMPRDVIPVCGVNIDLTGLDVSSASRLVERPEDLPIKRYGERCVITLDRLDLHEIVRIELPQHPLPR